MEQLDREGEYPDSSLRLHVRQITYQAHEINSYELTDPDGGVLPPFEPGAHIDFYFRDGSVRQYSLCNDPVERKRYVIAILRLPEGRGGSAALHERIHVQRRVAVGMPRNNFPINQDANHHIFLAGGIGVTPMKSMVLALERSGGSYEMHYCCKDWKHTAFYDEFAPYIASGKVKVHHDDGIPGYGLDIKALLEEPKDGTHVYYCGPPGFMGACERFSNHWPDGTVHYELFSPTASPKSQLTGEEMAQLDGEGIVRLGFQIKIASTGAMFTVPNDKSIHDVLAANGIEVDSTCKSGMCGDCKVRYLEGKVDHRDLILSEEEHAEYLTSCCSRSFTRELVLDL